MANIMSMKQLRNNVSRNGFDLSFKKNFTAKAGELLPIMCKPVLPGDKFTIKLDAFTRTQPLNTAAFVRMREYYDFYFVPYNLLWNKADTVLTQMNDNAQHSEGLNPNLNKFLEGKVPFVTDSQIADYIHSMNAKAADYTNAASLGLNYNGLRRSTSSVKLLEYLGIGNYEAYDGNATTWEKSPLMRNDAHNIFALLAYQKIYADHIRNSQWERVNPSSFNVDYITGSNDLNLDISKLPDYAYYNMFDLRYADWQKDMFQGVMANAQYGSSAVYELDIRNSSAGDSGINADTETAAYLDVLKLRQVEFLQKWKEIAQSGEKDYKDQIERHWNTKVGDYASELSQYLGGTSNTIGINEVVNTNITGEYEADIAGKGVGSSNGVINFDSNGRYGILMCIYHCVPLLDYVTDYVDPMHQFVEATDFAIPEFDRIGMEPVRLATLTNPLKSVINEPDLILGYAPRYISYKTSVDVSVGAFKRTLKPWVLGYDNESVINALKTRLDANGSKAENVSGLVHYSFFKVNPSVLDEIFGVEVNSSTDTDQFLCTSYFDIKTVRNLDVDGLPY